MIIDAMTIYFILRNNINLSVRNTINKNIVVSQISGLVGDIQYIV
jgi:hypothetical protein